MYRPPTIFRYFLYYGFLGCCIFGFLLTCCTFFFYRFLFKPLIFFLICMATLPLIGRELLKKDVPRQRTGQQT